MEPDKPEELLAKFEELSVLETEFEDVELEISESFTLKASFFFSFCDSLLFIPCESSRGYVVYSSS